MPIANEPKTADKPTIAARKIIPLGNSLAGFLVAFT